MRRPASWGVLAVCLAVAGCGVPGPERAQAPLDHLRERVALAAPPGLEVSVLRAGDPAGPRLILVHGTPGDAAGWADYLLAPPPGLEVVAIDRPGFGESEPEGPVVDLATQAAAVAALLPADGRKVVLLGHSLGAPIVARVAIDHPDRVSAVILLAGSLDPGLEKIHWLQPVGAWGPVRALLPRAIRNANAELLALKPELEDLADRLHALRAPVLIVHGTADDLVPYENVAFMRRTITGACTMDLMTLDGMDHFLPWNAQDTVRAAIDRALSMAGAGGSAAC